MSDDKKSKNAPKRSNLKSLLNDIRSGETSRSSILESRGRLSKPRGPGPRQVSQFAAYSPSDWREWLRFGIDVWTTASTSPERARAFAPLPVIGDQDGPVHLSHLLRRLSRFETKNLPPGISLLISTQAVRGDANAAEFAFGLAYGFGCTNFEEAFFAFFARDIELPDSQIEAFSTQVVQAIIYSASPAQAISMGDLLMERGFLTDRASADLVSYLCAHDSSQLYSVIAHFLPNLFDYPPSGEFARFFLNRLIKRSSFSRVGSFTYSKLDELNKYLINVFEHSRALAVVLADGRIRIKDQFSHSVFEASLPDDYSMIAFDFEMSVGSVDDVVNLDDYRSQAT